MREGKIVAKLEVRGLDGGVAERRESQKEVLFDLPDNDPYNGVLCQNRPLSFSLIFLKWRAAGAFRALVRVPQARVLIDPTPIAGTDGQDGR
jgi:hypothetical protein